MEFSYYLVKFFGHTLSGPLDFILTSIYVHDLENIENFNTTVFDNLVDDPCEFCVPGSIIVRKSVIPPSHDIECSEVSSRELHRSKQVVSNIGTE